ncbi:beta-microseminoprotein [Ictalurus punctatus]|uniref:Beta-microseminoprotein n=1 Tax=Ictalurus punctatus TaxID=7998 RepID=A0A9F7RLI1_ICTPU|nr:beta-microseminoprotein [Ictalurus punctatus]
MRSVFVSFVLLALIPVNHAACWSKIKPGVTNCWDDLDKKWHLVGSSWRTRECQTCNCEVDYMRCCDGWPSVSGGCTIEYDYKTCTYEVIVTDKSVPCTAVGK